MLYDSVLQLIGNTPLVKLNRVTGHMRGNFYAKCEFMNPGGSTKDRIALQMIIDAEADGKITPGDVLIEPSSGNTGIGLALAGALKGYRVVITMPEKMSQEKQSILKTLGAEVVVTPTEAPWDSPESHIGVAKQLQNEIPRSIILDQYSNLANPRAHYEFTAQEIIRDVPGNIDMVVVGAGTGGTVTGVAKAIKEKYPNAIIVAADPIGSILAGGDYVSSYKVEGIGYDFIPDVLDRSLIDRWVKTNDQDSFCMARKLILEEGLMCGGSSGAALQAVFSEGHALENGQNCVVILPDGIRNYMSKFIDDNWVKDHGFDLSKVYEYEESLCSLAV